MPGRCGRGRRGGRGCGRRIRNYCGYGHRRSGSRSQPCERGRHHGRGRGRSPGRHSPGRCSPGRHSPGRHSPGRHSPGRHSPGRHSPGRHSPGRHSPGRHSPGRCSPGSRSPGRHSPGRHSPGRCSPGRRSPGRHSPGRHSPGRRPPGHSPHWRPNGGGRLPPWILPIGPGRGPCRERPTVIPHKPDEEKPPQTPDKTEEPEYPKDERPITPELPEEELKTNLHVTEVDLQILTNGKTQHTDMYDLVEEERQLVIRRGEKFRFTFTLNQEYDPEKHKVRLAFQIGKEVTPAKGSFIRLPVTEQTIRRNWRLELEEQTDNVLTVSVFIPAKVIVGKWKMFIETKTIEKSKWLRKAPEEIYILFNPWCEGDEVYMENEAELQEYILNDSGCIYTGNARQISPKPWNFGQFEDGILEAAVFILNKGFNWDFNMARADPVRVSRIISQLVNSNDDEGVVYGNWSGVYDDGTPPTFWTGSVKILEEYLGRKKPVKYGQCWVYAGVTTTVCRALGIPSRCVSNFLSAHDTDGNITIDSYFTVEDGAVHPINEMNEDSVWNFHVWNEAWMKRPDLNKAEYNGWQVIDATPQEASEGVFCCGPAPVAAIKTGDIGVSFDCTFVFAEVNADKVLWLESEDGEFNVFQLKKAVIGKNISTKTPDGEPYESRKDQRLDITDNYKHPEGLDEEREAVIRASLNTTTDRSAYDQPDKGIEAELSFQDGLLVGQDFDVTITLRNVTDTDLVIDYLRLHADTTYYIGAVAGEIKTEHYKDVEVKAQETVTLLLTITKDEYLPQMAELNGIRLRLVGMVTGNDQYFVCEEDIRLETPKLELELPEENKVREPFTVKIRLINPLPVALTNGILSLEGPGIWKSRNIQIEEIASGEVWEKEVKLKAKRKGRKQVVASFDCEQLQDVTGSAVIRIIPA